MIWISPSICKSVFHSPPNTWEQRKLGDVTTRIVRKNKNLESTLPLTISSLYGLVDQITYFNNRVASRDVSNYYLVKRGEFAYNKSYSDGFPWGSVKRLDRYEMGVLSTLPGEFTLVNPPNGYSVRCTMDQAFQAIVVYTGCTGSACIEPWCGVLDSINNKRMIQWVPPGQSMDYVVKFHLRAL